MAGEKNLFAPLPLRAMAMDLSGLQLRVLMCVAAHDRMSLVTGKGQGCRASNERMRHMIGCDYARLCSTLSVLVDAGLLVREKPYGDKRMTVYRVVYSDDDRLLFGKSSASEKGCRSAKQDPRMDCREFEESGSFPPEIDSQYIPLNGGRDSVETGKEISSEEARFAAGGLARRSDLPVGARLAMLERALKLGEKIDCLTVYAWLETVEEDEHRHWARRLCDSVIDAMDDREYHEWGRDHDWVDDQEKWHAPNPREEWET